MSTELDLTRDPAEAVPTSRAEVNLQCHRIEVGFSFDVRYRNLHTYDFPYRPTTYRFRERYLQTTYAMLLTVSLTIAAVFLGTVSPIAWMPLAVLAAVIMSARFIRGRIDRPETDEEPICPRAGRRNF